MASEDISKLADSFGVSETEMRKRIEVKTRNSILRAKELIFSARAHLFPFDKESVLSLKESVLRVPASSEDSKDLYAAEEYLYYAAKCIKSYLEEQSCQ